MHNRKDLTLKLHAVLDEADLIDLINLIKEELIKAAPGFFYIYKFNTIKFYKEPSTLFLFSSHSSSNDDVK